jgi:hypothetical protein
MGRVERMDGWLVRLSDGMMGSGPLAALGRWWTRDRLVVLVYHGVNDRSCFAA